jgi:hypothetical protein
MPDETHKNYLRDLGYLIREKAEESQHDARSAAPEDRVWEKGRNFAYMEVVSLMQQQAAAFEIPFTDLMLDGIEPENDLLA